MFRRQICFCVLATLAALANWIGPSARGATVSIAAAAMNYNPGTLTGGYANPGSSWTSGPAIGLPAATEGGIFGDDSVITPFNAQYNPANMVGLAGSGGTIEFQMSQPVATSGYTLGVHVSAGLNDSSYPDGQNYPTANDYTNPRQATVLVSEDGSHWVSLKDQTFTNPTNIYTDETDPYGGSSGSNMADFAKPFTGTLASFNGEDFQQVLATLNGSGGGTWLDLSGTGLSEVNYVMLETDADQMPDEANESMYVNAITGIAVPEPGSGLLIIGLLSIGAMRRRRK